MDTFTFMIEVIIIMLALQFDQTWLFFGATAVIILSQRSISSIALVIVTAAVLYFLRNSLLEYSIFILFGLIILALVLGFGKKGAEPEMYAPDMYGGLMGGGGMGGY